ncbi:hypothetical protein OF820_10705 [Oceanotoga sp. DSM 15011]|uniref:hypothetical protein n=1 Tax=Oceanotoga sp. DSM 15011 TaxID=2984951 RepID=UPI0021F3EA91|nr:hypothetical protein [Oceanotoga sp. DSM 15011]UYO99534.1 hypothetical protein OF820_10705 [Oceanotoga sp. DSM 15011]
MKKILLVGAVIGLISLFAFAGYMGYKGDSRSYGDFDKTFSYGSRSCHDYYDNSYGRNMMNDDRRYDMRNNMGYRSDDRNFNNYSHMKNNSYSDLLVEKYLPERLDEYKDLKEQKISLMEEMRGLRFRDYNDNYRGYQHMEDLNIALDNDDDEQIKNILNEMINEQKERIKDMQDFLNENK